MDEGCLPQEVHTKQAGRGYHPINQYGIIGDLHSVALVGKDGSIDWCCLPHFDSPSVFAALLDVEKGGHFQIHAQEIGRVQQLYLPDTNVLITRFLSGEGVGEVMDFMPIDAAHYQDDDRHFHTIIRGVKAVRGHVHFTLECDPRFDYGRLRPKVYVGRRGVLFVGKEEALGLSGPVTFAQDGAGVRAAFALREGEELWFTLRYGKRGQERDLWGLREEDARKAFEATCDFWWRWAGKCTYTGRYCDMVRRSALTLKLLTFAPTGAIVAAPTTSLPEEIGGERNWDYRYCWLRDAAFTLYVLLTLGYTEEAQAFMKWVQGCCHDAAEPGRMQIVYGIDGRRELPEITLDHLEGYRGSRPVRIGNVAANQLQLDVYGEILDLAYLCHRHGWAIDLPFWGQLREMANWVCEHWQEPDEGIWEVRGGRRHFVYSKAMCWVAIDRAVRLARRGGFPADIHRWAEVQGAMYRDLVTRGWNEQRKAFVQHYDTDALDASVLLLPLIRFLPATDPRMLSTLMPCAGISLLTAWSIVTRQRRPLMA